MSNVVRYHPFREVLRFPNEFDRLFQLGRGLANDAESLNAWAPPVDIYEDQEGITLTAELPGLSASDLDLRVENNTLTLKGERKLEREDKRDNYKRIERYYGSFTRSFSLPPTVDAERIQAESKNGVLRVFLPRREESKPKQIKVKIDA